MLSSDKNVETIARLAEVLKHYLGLQAEYLKLDVIDKAVRLVKALLLAVLFFFAVMAVGFFMSFAFAYWLGTLIGLTPAFFIVSIAHVLIFVVIVACRKTLIERPLVRFLTALFLN